ncbi:tripartite tricarboxylate transporter substrate binding protein [Roseomonas sp. HF4]|uniref:Bug family tripartite tricarboxylate transporter substrate binding protein n=1 Tax=Roseomonas sp. HF4 TaxID=2562313 RepID=UPI0010BFCF0C|nr:tripartite tricarboxylate transporter substrate binding protein [Roseomonas sp. HF4]
MHRRTLLAALPALALATPARAQSWPTRPVRVIVPFPPGGTTDVVMRLIAQKLTETLGQPVVVENRAGAGGTIGSDVAAKSPPDGATFVVANIASQGVGPSVYRSMPYDAVRDFTYVAMIAEVPSVLAVNVNSPARTLAEFVALARQRPGIAVGSPGNGSASHVKQVLLGRLAGIETTHVPYRGSGPALNDLVAGQLDSLITTTVEAGRNERVRMLAVTSAERLANWPDLPTFAELGYRELVASNWFAIAGPAGLPAEVADRMHRETLAALREPAIADRLAQIGATPRPLSRAELLAFVAAEVARWGAIVRAAGVRIE